MRTFARACFVVFAALSIVTGVVYPLLVTLVAQVAYPERAEASLLIRHGHIVGSRLIGQPFDDPRYFWGRPSATQPFAYNAGASAGANASALSLDRIGTAQARAAALRASDPLQTALIPVDLVCGSGSGLDPDISPAAALYQAPRVARLRSLDEAQVRELVAAHTGGPTFGMLGEPRVNVLLLNLALDEIKVKERIEVKADETK